jgi:hypothetical protein
MKADADYETAPWVYDLRGGIEQYLHEIAGYDAERVLSNRERCTYADVATAWRYKKASESPFGYWKRGD